ncbi:putative alkaline shock family protein YloU [Frigoribacterium sp. PvP054]|uniref:Asp23/Gls24 family envelope stress response protein n=1 Tax=Frigoribacterium sp. PvP054 TaxID=3156438 RepID=UPI00339A351F
MSNAATPTPATITGSRVDGVSRLDGASTVSSDAAGTTQIADGVVAKVAGIAARQVPGVHSIGGGASRAVGALRSAVGQQDHGQGVKVEVGRTQAAADLSIVVDYPLSVQQVADDVRRAVSDAITQLVGLEVVEINIEVSDIFIAGQDDDADDAGESQRVR